MNQIKALIEKAQSDKDLMAKLDALGEKDAGADEVISLAKEYGFTVTTDEIEKMNTGGEELGELTEDELEAVAGGWSENRYDSTCKNMTRTKYNCVGFLAQCWCDHYRRERLPGPIEGMNVRFWHSCEMEAYKGYRGNNIGDPKS